MAQFQPLPLVWLLSDARNDARLEEALARLPPGSGFVFRHYHLGETLRRQRFDRLSDIARRHGHSVVLSDDAATARRWGAVGIYGDPERLGDAGNLVALATAHNADEIERAERTGADGIFLSPVFATRSHENARLLGPSGFQVLAQHTHLPVIALGGMSAARAAEIGHPRWGAIDGLA